MMPIGRWMWLLVGVLLWTGCADPLDAARRARDGGQYPEAARYYEQALAEGAPPEVGSELVSLHLDNGQLKAALAAMPKAEGGGSGVMWARAALMLYEAGELEASVAAYGEALKRDPKDPLAKGGKAIADKALARKVRIDTVRAHAETDLTALLAGFREEEGIGPASTSSDTVRFRPYLTPGLAVDLVSTSQSKAVLQALTVDMDPVEVTSASRSTLVIRREGDGLRITDQLRALSARKGGASLVEIPLLPEPGYAVEFKAGEDGKVSLSSGLQEWQRAIEQHVPNADATSRSFVIPTTETMEKRLQRYLDASPAFDGGRYLGGEDGVDRKVGATWYGLTWLDGPGGLEPAHYEARFLGWVQFRGVPVARVAYSYFGHPRHRFGEEGAGAEPFFKFLQTIKEVSPLWGDPDGPITGEGTQWIEPRTMLVMMEDMTRKSWVTVPVSRGSGEVRYQFKQHREVMKVRRVDEEK